MESATFLTVVPWCLCENLAERGYLDRRSHHGDAVWRLSDMALSVQTVAALRARRQHGGRRASCS
jgi:hypothetical protein